MPNLKELASLLASGCGKGIFAEALGIPATFAPIWSSSPIVYFDQPSAWWLNSRQGEWQAASIQASAAVWLVK
jgi:hypothetical protein